MAGRRGAAGAARYGRNTQLIWGTGDNIPGFESTDMATNGDSPLKMVSQWYNGPADLSYIHGYQAGSTFSDYYGRGYTFQLIVWLADVPAYAIDAQFQTDFVDLMTTCIGNGPNHGPLYIVLFTELETYSNAGNVSTYNPALKAAYFQAMETARSMYSQAYVGLGFGGYDWSGNPTPDLSFWDDALKASDFVCVQHMQDSINTGGTGGQNEIIDNIQNSVTQLGAYGKPVMISHMLLWGDTSTVVPAFADFRKKILSTPALRTLAGQGLFAIDFMNGGGAQYLDSTTLTGVGPTEFAITKAILRRHQATSVAMPIRSGHKPPPAFAAAGSYLSGDAASAAVPVPAGVAANDIILVHLYLESSATVTAPTGFTELTPAANVTAPYYHRVFWRRAAGAVTGSFGFTWTGTVYREAVATSYRGAVTSGSPVDAQATGARSSAGTTTPGVSVTTTGVDRLLVWCGGDANGGTWTVPAGWRPRVTGAHNMAVASMALSATGGSGTITGVSTVSDQQTAWLVALIPA